MAEYYTKSESDAKYAATSHTHALEDMGGTELPADRVSIPEAAAPLFEDAYTLDVALFSVADQLAGKAAADHTHENLSVTPAPHTHGQSEVTGLEARLTEIEADIADLQSGAGSNVVAPMLVASMHLGKLDNNSGAEVTSASRICSEPFAIQSGKSYWQVNDKGVNMYVLIYDADEMFLAYLGNIPSGTEIVVDNANAAYMRISSLVGEYDLTNEYRIYDVDPASGSGGDTAEEGFTQEEADLLYAPIDHTHDGYAAAAHTHTADDITGLPSSIDAYSKTESDERFAPAAHSHGEYLTEDEAVDAFAGVSHTHTPASIGAAASSHTHTPSSIGAAASSHTHSGYASTSHGHANYASATHSHTASDVGALSSSGGTVSGDLTVTGTMISNGVLNTQTIQPKDSGSYSIGNSDKRYYSTYLKVNPNVASDRRCKRDIETMDIEALAAFVGKLSVVNYNYNDDAADEAKRIGLIAQDVVAADSEIAKGCIEQDEKGFYSLRAADLVFPLIAAIQAQNKRIADLEAKLEGK